MTHIVLGAGTVGLAAAHWLGRRTDADILVIEQGRLDLAARGGPPRIVRHAFTSPAYARLSRAAFAAWTEVERSSGVRLVTPTGGLTLAAGARAQEIVEACREACDLHAHPYEVLDAPRLMRRWPQWQVPEDALALHQPGAGVLDVRRANAAQLALARAEGVTFLDGAQALRIGSDAAGVRVSTTGGEFVADTLTVCAGPGTVALLESLGVPVPISSVTEQVSTWSTVRLREFAADRFPVWSYVDDAVRFSGLPVSGEVAVTAGRQVQGPARGRVIGRPEDEHRSQLELFMEQHLPDALGPELTSHTRVHELLPDRDFLLDTVPGHRRVAVFAGSGRSATFASLIGLILSDLALDRETSYPIDPFRFDRPAIRGEGHRRRGRTVGRSQG